MQELLYTTERADVRCPLVLHVPPPDSSFLIAANGTSPRHRGVTSPADSGLESSVLLLVYTAQEVGMANVQWPSQTVRPMRPISFFIFGDPIRLNAPILNGQNCNGPSNADDLRTAH